ncbi:MAG: hypothetical protein ACI4XR_05165 [Bacilli bacterium]
MYYSWNLPNKEEFKDVLLRYYLFYEENFGKNILSKVTKKNINNNNFNNSILFLDENYKRACEAAYSIFFDDNIKFLTVRDSNNNTIACSRIKLSIEDHPNNAIVGEILLSIFIDNYNKEEYYINIIKFIEDYIKSNNELSEILTFEVPHMDWVFFDACEELGYNLLSEPNKDYSITSTYLFDKNIREKEEKRTV